MAFRVLVEHSNPDIAKAAEIEIKKITKKIEAERQFERRSYEKQEQRFE